VQAPPELVEIDRAYTLLAERLQRNERERALLLAGVSHDLRSPLSRIRLAAEMLPELPDNADGVASITRNVDHADRLTASFLDFVRTGAVHLTETVDVAAVVRAAVARFDRPAADLQARTPEHLVLQQAHALLVDRLIVNLVDNALKHGGTPVAVDLAQHGDDVVISVSDAGPGLPQGGAARLLEAFARGDASRGVPGFGLGLAIAQQIVVRLQGQLAFAQDGQRHRVTVSLPLVR
jgi:two-component system osmolarity sensor histidine kinase EnvZ